MKRQEILGKLASLGFVEDWQIHILADHPGMRLFATEETKQGVVEVGRGPTGWTKEEGDTLAALGFTWNGGLGCIFEMHFDDSDESPEVAIAASTSGDEPPEIEAMRQRVARQQAEWLAHTEEPAQSPFGRGSADRLAWEQEHIIGNIPQRERSGRGGARAGAGRKAIHTPEYDAGYNAGYVAAMRKKSGEIG